MNNMLVLYHKACDLQNSIKQQILDSGIAWQHLADNNETILAIHAYRKQHSAGLREARDAIAAFHAQASK